MMTTSDYQQAAKRLRASCKIFEKEMDRRMDDRFDKGQITYAELIDYYFKKYDYWPMKWTYREFTDIDGNLITEEGFIDLGIVIKKGPGSVMI